MKKNKILVKGIIAFIAIISVFSACEKLSSALALAECTSVNENNVRYVNATFTDINPEKYNALMRGFSSEVYYPKSVEEREPIDKKALMFGQTEGMTVGGIQNGFIGANRRTECDGVLQGLVENKLENGSLKVANRFQNGKTLFPDSGETGWDKPYNEILANWKMPFLKESNGYYSFNSDEYHLSRDYANKKFVLHKGARSGFFPFNNCSDDTYQLANRNLYFTAKIEIPFMMTTDGKVKNSTTGLYEDMVFNFSGDDDVWVFVDDTLVLDLGGVHIKQTGNINFAKNQVYYSSVYNESNDSDSFNIYKTAFQGGKLSQGKHTLKLFYMERAGGVSNLFASFNLQSSGVETKYIEKYTNKELASTIKTGAVGESIELEEKQFEDKVLCERPKETTVTLKEELQTFKFYYKNKYTVTADYLDFFDKSKVEKSETQKVVEDDKYSTQSKTVKDYTLVEVPSNASGTMPHNDVNVQYFYKYNNAKIKVKYVDKTTGDELAQDTLTGTEGEIATPEDKTFDEYVLVEKPGETRFSKKEQEITYYYKHKGKIIVNYIDKATQKNLDQAILNGIEGETVTSEQKSFEGFELYSAPESNKHIIQRTDQEVNYYYIHKSKIVVNYLDIDTDDSLDRVEDTVTEGTIYELEEKEFKYYKLVQKPEALGVLIGKENIEVNFYYQKLKFNLKLEMNLKQSTINGGYHELKNKLGKIEVNKEDANSNSSCKIHYIIKVTNDQEREGSGMLTDHLPEGYYAIQEDNPLWSISSDALYMQIDNIQSGETREFELILTKKEGVELCKTINNKISINSIDVEETNLNDNEDQNEVVIMPRTGIEKIILGATFILPLIIATMFIIKKKIKGKNISKLQ